MREYLHSHNLKMKILPWGTIDGRHLTEEEHSTARAAIRSELDGHRSES